VLKGTHGYKKTLTKEQREALKVKKDESARLERVPEPALQEK